MTTKHNTSVPSPGGHSTHHHRKAIPATCALERGPVEEINLVVSKRGGTIVLDPQVPGACVISLDEERATALGNLLSLWLV